MATPCIGTLFQSVRTPLYTMPNSPVKWHPSIIIIIMHIFVYLVQLQYCRASILRLVFLMSLGWTQQSQRALILWVSDASCNRLYGMSRANIVTPTVSNYYIMYTGLYGCHHAWLIIMCSCAHQIYIALIFIYSGHAVNTRMKLTNVCSIAILNVPVNK